MAERFAAIKGRLRRFSEHKWPAINGGETAVQGSYKRTSLLSNETILSTALLFFSLLGSFLFVLFSFDFQFGDSEKSQFKFARSSLCWCSSSACSSLYLGKQTLNVFSKHPRRGRICFKENVQFTCLGDFSVVFLHILRFKCGYILICLC